MVVHRNDCSIESSRSQRLGMTNYRRSCPNRQTGAGYLPPSLPGLKVNPAYKWHLRYMRGWGDGTVAATCTVIAIGFPVGDYTGAGPRQSSIRAALPRRGM